MRRKAERLNVGIIRIDEASILIQEIDKKLEIQRKELAIKTKKCDDLLTEITNLTAKQTERKSQVSIRKKELVDEQLITIEKEKHDTESQLEEAMSALIEAQQSLDTLKAADITEMRSFDNPFDTLGLIDYCMLIYLDHPSISWKDVRAVMADMKFITNLKTQYKDKYGYIDIVLFNDALEHLTRIYRVLRLDRGHLLLIGTGGSGKKLLAKIAGFTAKCQIFEIQLTRNYNEISFREDLKILFYQIGLKNIKTVFILNDAQIVEENFLEYINNILSNGIVPGLFTDEERDGIINEIREEAIKYIKILSNENIWHYFIRKCTLNLHIILCMNPTGNLLRNRARNFPALINNTTIDYFARWPQQALYAVAEHFLSRFKLISDEYKNNIIEHMAMVHESVNFYCDIYMEKMRRKAYATPTNYLDFIHTFIHLYKQKKEDLSKQAERLNVGIIRIDEASILIQEMDKKLEIQRKELAIKTKKCDDLLTEITTLTAKQTERKSRALDKKQLVDEQLITIEKEKHDAESQLEEAMPALIEAQQGLDTLKAADITEMRSFANPVDTLRLIGYCMLIYLGHPSISWKDVRAVMADMKFITNLKTQEKLDPNHMHSLSEKSERNIKLVILMTNVSRVGGSLLKFIHAIDNYMDIYRETKPKKDRLLSIENDYKNNLSELNRLEISIEKLTNVLNDFRKRFDTAMEDKLKFQDETDIAIRRRIAAEKLLIGFKSEIILFIHLFIFINKKKEDLSKQAERLNAGIIRIDEASVLIQEMDKKLEIQRKELG
ncbi:unnamed protein product [Rotaria sp. Silwood2]|nr:unnamed protein product [Rotaria sp. Silwood2]